jgi:metal-dependent amidase/aminoacylase/carboxypeptidase family protein
MSSIATNIDHYLPEIIAFRRDLHQNPEIGYLEIETARKVKERLELKGGFHIQGGIAQTGIVATLGKDKPGKGIALRADMDCLPS